MKLDKFLLNEYLDIIIKESNGDLDSPYWNSINGQLSRLGFNKQTVRFLSELSDIKDVEEFNYKFRKLCNSNDVLRNFGNGSFKNVYGFIGNKEYVLKTINSSSSISALEYELNVMGLIIPKKTSMMFCIKTSS